MSMTAEEFSFVADLVRDRSAISIGPGKEYLVESRLAPLARSAGLRDIRALIGELRRPARDPEMCARVVEAMTTNETSFFRDIHPFDTLRDQLLPEIVERNAGTRRLRIWSAASSTGQELYSIAMLLDRHFPQVAQWDLTLLGTDLSTDVITRARAGRFSPLEVNRGLPAQLMARYFERDGAEYVIDPRLRSWCRFERMNLAEPWPAMPLFDVVFCRNVLIYFDIEVRRTILGRIRTQLARNGHLLLGASETTVGIIDGFDAVRLGNTVAYRPEV